MEGGGDITQGTEFELRLAGCLDTAVRAAMTEVLQHVKDNRLIETKMIQAKAQEATQAHLRAHPLE